MNHFKSVISFSIFICLLALAASQQVLHSHEVDLNRLYDYDGRIPISEATPLEPQAPPVEADGAFLLDHSDTFKIYWDQLLRTPRLILPKNDFNFIQSSQLQVISTNQGSQDIAESVATFIDQYSDFFGVTREQLSAPYVKSFKYFVLVSYRQKFGDIYVRGANIRFVFNRSNGNLVHIKSFLLREDLSPAVPFESYEPAVELVKERYGEEILDIEKQYIFPNHSLDEVLPIWRIKFDHPENPMGEMLIDGVTLDQFEVREFRFESGLIEASIQAFTPTQDPSDPNYLFVTPFDFNELELTSLPDITVKGITTQGKTDEHGVVDLIDDGRPVFNEETGENELVSEITALLLYGRCKEELWFETERGFAGEMCAVGIFDENGELIEDGEQHDPGAVLNYEPTVRVMHSCRNLKLRKEVQFVKNEPDKLLSGRAVYQLNKDKLITSSGYYMAYHHAVQFDKSLYSALEEDRDQLRHNIPLDLNTTGRAFDGDPIVEEEFTLHYFPKEKRGIACLPVMIINLNRDIPPPAGPQFEQPLTPTIINHEVAHHMIFQLTGALQGFVSDCGFRNGLVVIPNPDDPPGEGRGRCLINEGKFNNPIFGENSTLEGFTDALAAIKQEIPKFGYIDFGRTAGPHAYDISDLGNNDTIEPYREVVANAIWNIFADARSLTTDKEVREFTTEFFEKGFYNFFLTNHMNDGASRAFAFPPTTIEEISSAVIEVLTQILLNSNPTNDQRSAITNIEQSLDLSREQFDKFIQRKFLRGDANSDGLHNISDPLFILELFFNGKGHLVCSDAADVNDDGNVDLTDAIYSLSFQFLGNPQEIPAPGLSCGFDPTDDQLFFCEFVAVCRNK